MSDKKLAKQRRLVYWRLLKHVKRYSWFFGIGLLGTVLASSVDGAFTFLLRPILDKGFIEKDLSFIQIIPLIIIGLFLLRGIAGFTSNYFMQWVGRRIVMDFRQALFERYVHMPASFHDNHSSGNLLSVLTYNVEQVANASTTAIVTFVRESVLIFSLLVVMFINSWQLSLVFVIIGPIVAFVVTAASRRLRRLSHSVQDSMGKVTARAEEGIEGYKVIRAFGGQQFEIDNFNKATDENRHQEMKMVVTSGISFTGMQLLLACTTSIVISIAMSGLVGPITAGTFTSLVGAMLALMKPIKSLSNINGVIQKGIAGADSIFNLLDLPIENDDGVHAISHAKGDIRFDKVRFSYDNNHTVLNAISFHIKSGQTCAFVGKSGSGKTSLVNLLPRFYSLQSGNIYLDHLDINHYQLKNLREQFAFVSQHVTLFNETIAHNIAYGDLSREHSLDDIYAAATSAHAMEFIETLPNGFNTIVGDNGVLLSGGQRQRIAIARAILKDAPILILDEATSALDSESEYFIQLALDKLMQKKTTLVIAHRLSTIKNADQIFVMDNGSIVESGRHDELLEKNNYYAKLYHLQFSTDSPVIK